MFTMDWTAFSMPCCANVPRLELGRWRDWLLGLCLLLGMGMDSASWAQGAGRADAAPVRLERTSEGLFLSARLPLQLPPSLEDALRKGVPLHFVWSTEWVRPRWYWWDQKQPLATRTVRLAFQPLTRRWRVSIGSGEQGGNTPNALHQNVDSLSEAVVAAFRVSDWLIAEPGTLEPKSQDRLRLRFQLDTGLLPRPFQIGIGSTGDWSLAYETTLSIPPLTGRTEAND